MKNLRIVMTTLVIQSIFMTTLAVAAEQVEATGSTTPTLEMAGQVFDRMFTTGLTPEERAKVNVTLKDANGFVVLPNVLKIGIGLTRIQGRGVLVYRDAKGVWQPPIPLLVSGQGVGPHFGLIAYDALIPIMKPISLDELLNTSLAFTGREAIGPLQSYGAGPGGLVAYARGKGLSAGMAQDTIRITLDQEGIQSLYDIHVEPHEIAAGRLETCRKPLPAQKLIEKAHEVTGHAPITTILTPQ